MAASDYPRMLALVEQGALRPDLLVSRIIGLEEAAAELPYVGERAAIGITIVDPRLS
jgi:alcohol dehydrogenase